MKRQVIWIFVVALAVALIGGAPTFAQEEEVNINTADEAALTALKGINPKKAKAIIEYRDASGPIMSSEDLLKVPGIKEKDIKKIESQTTY
jgi:competence protein ComEA